MSDLWKDGGDHQSSHGDFLEESYPGLNTISQF
jgi:hypothetical protein